MIVIGDLKDGDKVMHCRCGSNCEEQFIFKMLEKKEKIKFTCPQCGGKNTIKRMADGMINRVWSRV